MKIYVLTQGEYSDYHIIGVFTNKELGERALRVISNPDDSYDLVELEEFEDNEIGKDDRFKFGVTISDVDARANFTDYYNTTLNEVIFNDVTPYNRNAYYHVYVMAEDREHAIKIASDLVAQYKASH